MVATLIPSRCGMASCENIVENPGYDNIVVVISEGSNLQIPVCGECKKRLAAPSEFNFYSMN